MLAVARHQQLVRGIGSGGDAARRLPQTGEERDPALARDLPERVEIGRRSSRPGQ